jgi:hypothetical protein
MSEEGWWCGQSGSASVGEPCALARLCVLAEVYDGYGKQLAVCM